jgi:hypothetical protein
MKAIKHLVRTVSANPNPMSGSDSVGDVERELAVYFEGGWELYSVQVIGSSAGNVTMLYVLTKEPESYASAVVPLEVVQAKRGRPAKANTETTEV